MAEDAVPRRSSERLQSRSVRGAQHHSHLEFLRTRDRSSQHSAPGPVRTQTPLVIELMTIKSNLRRFTASAHLWIGLSAGAFICLMGVTGAIVSLRPQIASAL